MPIPPKYQTTGRRYLASLIDSFIFLPIALLPHQYERTTEVTAFIGFTMLHVVLFMLYLVIGHGRYGQTFGKRLLGIQVLDIRERQVIGLRNAFLRECVWFFAQMTGVVYLIVESANSSSTIAVHQTYFKSIVALITSLWFILEVVTMLFNNKRRALHDFIAGSVVVIKVELEREILQKERTKLFHSLPNS